MVVDLRSDTITLPTEAMWAAMRNATLADDSLEGDDTVQRLEAMAAELLGKEAALFVTSGTMGNLVASLSHGGRGGEAIADANAHIITSEAGGIARLAGLMCHGVPGGRGEMDLEAMRGKLRASHTRSGQPTAMVVIETSHNHSGGTVPSLPYMRQVRELAHDHGAAVHVDGARVFNAAAALGVSVREIAAMADSLTFCLSKGLSAPMGSLLAGSSSFIERARTYRRMVGGGLRQAGIMAAAGVVALRDMPARLVDDHRSALQIWEVLRQAGSGLVSADAPETNILMIDVRGAREQRSASEWVSTLAQAGVAVRARDAFTLRLVTHRHIDLASAERAARVIAGALGSAA